MSSEFGKKLKVSVFGESHGRAVGVVVNGLPAGERVNMEELSRFLARRRPGMNPLTTGRQETDQPEFLAGIRDGVICGSPLAAVIFNQDAHSGDYTAIQNTPRPGHADYTAFCKWGGWADMRGGGHFSGRLTAPICVAGGIALQILKRRGIFVGAHLASVGDVKDASFPLLPKSELLAELAQKRIPVLDDQAGERMEQAVTLAASRNDSLGGSVECVACGLPAGLGEPMFDGVENRLAQALFGIPAVKGLEFGNGFECINMHGSENNDEFSIGPDGSVVTRTNHCGGILGGITDGMPVSFRVALKPTPSIGKPQRTVNLKTMAEADMTIAGRHDPCVALRAVPAVEAITGLVLLDLLLEETKYGLE